MLWHLALHLGEVPFSPELAIVMGDCLIEGVAFGLICHPSTQLYERTSHGSPLQAVVFTRIHNCPFGFKCNFYDGYWCPCPTVCRVAAMTLPGKEVVQSPRAVLKAQVAEAKKRGYVFKSGVEALF